MFTLSSKTIDPAELSTALADKTTGACVTFEGIVRNHNDGRAVASLEYEADEELCQNEAKKIFQEAYSQFSISKAVCQHRTGHLKIGDAAVWVGVSAAHRDEAFKACRYIIDHAKNAFPFGRKSSTATGNPFG